MITLYHGTTKGKRKKRIFYGQADRKGGGVKRLRSAWP